MRFDHKSVYGLKQGLPLCLCLGLSLRARKLCLLRLFGSGFGSVQQRQGLAAGAFGLSQRSSDTPCLLSGQQQWLRLKRRGEIGQCLGLHAQGRQLLNARIQNLWLCRWCERSEPSRLARQARDHFGNTAFQRLELRQQRALRADPGLGNFCRHVLHGIAGLGQCRGARLRLRQVGIGQAALRRDQWRQLTPQQD